MSDNKYVAFLNSHANWCKMQHQRISIRAAANEITRLSLLVSKYEAAIDEHKGDRRLSDWNNMCDVKLWQTREK